MNKLKFVVLAHLYMIRMLWNHGLNGANEFFALDETRRFHVNLYCDFMGFTGSRRKEVMRKHAIHRLKEASLKK